MALSDELKRLLAECDVETFRSSGARRAPQAAAAHAAVPGGKDPPARVQAPRRHGEAPAFAETLAGGVT